MKCPQVNRKSNPKTRWASRRRPPAIRPANTCSAPRTRHRHKLTSSLRVRIRMVHTRVYCIRDMWVIYFENIVNITSINGRIIIITVTKVYLKYSLLVLDKRIARPYVIYYMVMTYLDVNAQYYSLVFGISFSKPLKELFLL